MSSYKKCAEAFKKDILIIHLPCGLIDSKSNPREHVSKQYHTVDENELQDILCAIICNDGSSILALFKSIVEKSTAKDTAIMKQFLNATILLCQNLLKDVR